MFSSQASSALRSLARSHATSTAFHAQLRHGVFTLADTTDVASARRPGRADGLAFWHSGSVNGPVSFERKRRLFSWACFDFANSAFTTLVGTFVYSNLFIRAIAPDTYTGTQMWGMAVALSSVAIGLLSPALGAIADAYGWKRRFMASFIVLCSIASCALYFPEPGQALWALALFSIGTIAVEMAIVFNNAFLPEIAPREQHGKISGLAFAAGYAGGLICLGLALVGFIQTDQPWFGLSQENAQSARATSVLTGVWVLVFSIPMLLWVKDSRKPKPASGPGEIAAQSFRRLSETFRHIRSYRNVFWLFLARVFYNDGLVTVFAFGAIYATGTFGFALDEVLKFGIVLNVCAGLGAFLFSFIEDRIGSRITIIISLICLLVSSAAAVLVQTQGGFWVCAIVLGLFIGPNQSASRAFLSRMAPPEKVNEFFGFFAFSGKATSFLGPLFCGILTAQFDSQRVGMTVVPILFAVGLWLMFWKTEPAMESGAAQ